MFLTACPGNYSLGIGNGNFPSQYITASSIYKQPVLLPGAARMNKFIGNGGWCGENRNTSDYWQVDFGENITVQSVGIQRAGLFNYYVSQFSLQYSYDGVIFRWYTGGGTGPYVSVLGNNLLKFRRSSLVAYWIWRHGVYVYKFAWVRMGPLDQMCKI